MLQDKGRGRFPPGRSSRARLGLAPGRRLQHGPSKSSSTLCPQEFAQTGDGRLLPVLQQQWRVSTRFDRATPFVFPDLGPPSPYGDSPSSLKSLPWCPGSPSPGRSTIRSIHRFALSHVAVEKSGESTNRHNPIALHVGCCSSLHPPRNRGGRLRAPPEDELTSVSGPSSRPEPAAASIERISHQSQRPGTSSGFDFSRHEVSGLIRNARTACWTHPPSRPRRGDRDEASDRLQARLRIFFRPTLFRIPSRSTFDRGPPSLPLPPDRPRAARPR